MVSGPMPKFTVPKSHRYCSSLGDLAKHMGMSIKTLDGWCRQDLIRKKQKGWYSRDVMDILEEKVKEAEETEAEKLLMDESEGSKVWLEEQRKWAAKIKELQYLQRKEELLDRESVLDDTCEVLRQLRSELMRLPKILRTPLSRMGDVNDVEEKLIEELSGALNKVSDWVGERYEEGKVDVDGGDE